MAYAYSVVNIWAEIGAAKLEISYLFSLFGLNEIPFCYFDFGVSDEPGFIAGMDEAIEFLSSIENGENIKIVAKLRDFSSEEQRRVIEKDVTVFFGIFQGWGHVTINGVMQVRIWAAHWLMALQFASARVDAIHARALSQSSSFCAYKDSAGLLPELVEDAGDDLWKDVIKPELLFLAEEGKIFDLTNSEAASAILSGAFKIDSIPADGSEIPLDLSVFSNVSSFLRAVKKALFHCSEQDISLWDVLTRAAGNFKFAVSPRILDFSVAPFFPLLGGDISEITATIDDFYHMQEFNLRDDFQFDSYFGFQGISSKSSPFDVAQRKALFQNLRTDGNLGKYMEKAPPWLFRTEAESSFAPETLGLRDFTLKAAGYFLEDFTVEEKTLNQEYNVANIDLTNKWMQCVLGERSFESRTVLCRGSLNFDYCPGSQVVLALPGDEAGGEEPLKFIGTVYRVGICVDVNFKRSGTWLIATHLRSEEEQKNLPSLQHPLYQNRWIRAPLLTGNQFAREAEIE